MIYIVIALLILFALWNGKVIIWCQAKVKKDSRAGRYSKQWHGIGLVIRILLLVYIVYVGWFDWEGWKEIVFDLLLFLNVSYTVYDIIINLTMKSFNPKVSIWHVDNKGINGFMIKLISKTGLWIARLVLILFNILIPLM